MNKDKLIKEYLEKSVLPIPSEDFNKNVLLQVERQKQVNSKKNYFLFDDFQLICVTIIFTFSILFLLAIADFKTGILIAFLLLLFLLFIYFSTILTKRNVVINQP